ncbi:nuclease-related domain-containing protein [Halalkalibacter okhensis]|nr:nuclease-related domain-containing protein [Halalkalibacter okhensis]
MSLEKGYKGEQQFDKWLNLHTKDMIVLNDLLLEHNNTIFQIDSLVITSNTLYLFEIKNYEGDFYMKGDRWYSLSNTEIKNPLFQLQRTESLFRRLLEELHISSPIEAYVVFISPEFQLYQTPLNLPIIFSTQLKRFFNQLQRNSSPLKEINEKLAKQILTLHLPESPYTRLPKYDFPSLKKGIYCPTCQSFYTAFSNKKTIQCNHCSNSENSHAALKRTIEEFILLFPKKKITTNIIYEWSNKMISKKTIRKILSINYEHKGHSSSSHYVKPK